MSDKNIGYVAELKGSADVRDTDGIIKVLHQGDKLFEGDVVTTSDNSEIVIEFFNGQQMVVAENTEILLDESVYAGLEPFADDRVDQLAELQQMILEGNDLTQLPSTATGQIQTQADALHTASVYTRDAIEGTIDTDSTPFNTDSSSAEPLVTTSSDSLIPAAPAPTDFAVASISVDPISGDGIINAAEANANVNITGNVGGDAAPGDSVTVEVNGQQYSGVVADDGSFSVVVPGVDLVTDNNVNVSVSGSDEAGNTYTASTSTASDPVIVDLVGEATLVVDNVTPDNIINAAEQTGEINITGRVGGEAAAGDSVVVMVNGHEYTGTVNDDSQFSIAVSATDLVADSTVNVTLSGSDDAGNPFTISNESIHLIDTTAQASISVDAITPDDIVNAAEAAGSISVSGSVGGDASVGDIVSFTVNGQDYSGTVDADGRFAIDVAGSDLAADNEFTATVSGSDDVGNPFSASTVSTHTIDLLSRVNISVDQVTSDNIINASEANQQITLTGTVEGDAKDGDQVTLTINGNSYLGVVSGGGFAIDVAGSDLALDSEIVATVTGTDHSGNLYSATTRATHSIDTAASASISVDAITADDIINAAEAGASIYVRGKVGGDAANGDIVSFTINGQQYSGEVAGGAFAIAVEGSDLAADNSFVATVSGNDAAGNPFTASTTSTHGVDTTASATIQVDAITADDILNAAEAAGSVTVSGSVGADAGPGDFVSFTVNGTDYVTTVAADGRFSVAVAGADLQAQTSFDVSVNGSDEAGNPYSASTTSTHTVDLTASGSIAVDPVTDDDVINAAESQGTVDITGTVAGDVAPGDMVTLNINGQTYSGLVASDNSFSINVAGSDLAAVTSLEASVNGVDGAGNPFNASTVSTYSVDTDASASIHVDPITADNMVTEAEAQNDIVVSGSVGGDAVAGDIVSFTLNGVSYSGTVAADKTFSIPVAGSDLMADNQFDVTVSGTDQAGNPYSATTTSTHTVNHDPQAVTDTVTTDEDVAVSINVLSNDTDADSDTLSVTAASALHGTVVINADNTLNYTPDSNYNGADQISYSIADGKGGVDTAVVDVTINPVNDIASVSADTGSVVEDAAATLITSGQISVSDVDTGEAQIQPQSNVAGLYGSFSIAADGSWQYSADNSQSAIQQLGAGEQLTESFTVTSQDGSASNTVSISIEGTNDAPILSVSDLAATEDGAAITGQASFSDVDVNDSHSYSVSTLPAGQGSVSIDANTGQYSYNIGNDFQSLGAGETTNVSFDVTVTDNHGASDTQTVNVTITGTNDAPIVSAPVVASANEDDASFNIDLLANASDVDIHDSLSISNLYVTSGDASGISQNGNQLSVDPSAYNHLPAGASETIHYSYDVIDGQGGVTGQTATITITGSNDVASVSADTGSVVEDAAATLTTSGQVSVGDVDTGEAQIQPQSNVAGHYGSFSIAADGSWQYSADNSQSAIQQLGAGEQLTESFTVTSQDGSASNTVTININGTNDAPILSVSDLAATEDGAAITGQASFSDVDVNDTHSYSVSTLPAGQGSVSIDTNTGLYTYDVGNDFQHLAAGETTNVSFDVTVTDSQGASDTQTVNVTITGTNDAPVAVVDSYSVDEGSSINATVLNGVLSNDSDVDSSSVNVTQYAADSSGTGAVTVDGVTTVTTALGGTVLLNADGSFVYTAPASLDHSASDTLVDSFAYLASDGIAESSWTTVSIDVNDTAPVSNPDIDSVGYGGDAHGNVITGEGGSAMAADDTGADVPVALVSVNYQGGTYNFGNSDTLNINADHGSLVINKDGAYIYSSNELTVTPVADEVFEYSLQDADGDISSASLTLVHDTINTAIENAISVQEAGLAAGTQHQSNVETSSGNLLDNDTGIAATTEISSVTFAGVTATPVAGVISIDGDYGSLTLYTVDDGTHRAGDYSYTLTAASSGDSVAEHFSYQLTDSASGHTSSADLVVSIVDDAPGGDPVVQNLQTDADPMVYNLSIVLDVSGSMGWDAGNGQSRLEVAKQSLQALINEVDDLGNVNVQIVAFSSSVTTSNWFVDDIYSALDYIDALSAGGGTRYDAALNAQISSAVPPPGADQNLVYFISDGEPNSGYGVDNTITYTDANGNDLNGLAAWETYVEEHVDIAFGIGIGAASLNDLELVAHPEVSGSEPYAISVADPLDLTATLLDTVSNNVISGSLNVLGVNGSTGFVIGADGGYISEITVDGTRYSYDPASGDPATLSVTTALGGQLDIDFSTGEYTYTLNVDQSVLGQTELFPVTVIDNDGDSASSTIQFNIDYQPGLDVNRDIIISNVIDGSPLNLTNEALMHNDQHGQNATISAVGNAQNGTVISNSDAIEFDPAAAAFVLSENDFETVNPAFELTQRNEGANSNDTAATATDLTDRSLFSSNSSNLAGESSGLNGYAIGYYGSIENATDQDWLKVTLAKGELIWVDVDDANLATTASVYDSAGNFVETISNSGSSPWGGFTAANAGDYFIVLEAQNNGDSGNYDVYLTIDADNADYSALSLGSFDYSLDNGSGILDAASVDFTAVDSNTLTGSDRDEILLAGDGNDTLVSNAGDDVLIGNAGDDHLQGGAGNDLLIGGIGNDSLIGGGGIDIFALEAGDEGSVSNPAIDSIADFNVGNGGDVLDLSDMLQNEQANPLDSYLNFNFDSSTGDTTINIDIDGNSGITQQVVLENIDLTSGGTLSDQQILDNLLDNGNLVVDH